ncbi:MAG: hypothetical protein PHW27_09575 [Melioribacteraceae bacterium]|nr:hypothetical protein [Melioribacteraceae bacterium]
MNHFIKNHFSSLITDYRSLITFLLLISYFLFLNSCNSTEPPKPEPTESLTLSLIDITSKEAWIKIEPKGLSFPLELLLFQDEYLREALYLRESDTIYVDTSLEPSTTYIYQIRESEPESNKLQFTTKGITSSEFSWESWTFGDASQSLLYDVKIIDNKIWVVGSIYMKDSLGNTDPNAYNAVYWNGSQWDLKRLRYFGQCSVVKYPPLYSLWAFDSTKILLTNGGSIASYDGTNVNLDCNINSLINGVIYRLWGNQTLDSVYVIGSNGSILSNKTGRWRIIGTDTDLDFTDIIKWDTPYKSSIFAIAGRLFSGRNSELYEITENGASLFEGSALGTGAHSIYAEGMKMYVVGGHKYEYLIGLNEFNNITSEVSNRFLNKLDGQEINDIIGVGTNLEIVHFNGIEWTSIPIDPPSSEYGEYFSVDYTNDIICAVGIIGAKGIITVGRRNSR